MASATDTLAGILLLGDMNNADIDVSDLLDDAPVIRALAAVQSSHGTTHKYNKRTVAAGVGFRAIGAGQDNAAGSIEQVTETLKLLDATPRRDIAAAKGFRGGEEAYMANEARWSLRAAFAHAEKQLIDGTGNEADGFNGLADHLYTDDVGDTMVVDAGGSGGNNVWLVRSTPDDVAVVTNGEIEVGALGQVAIYDGSASYPGYQLPILSWLALQVGSIRTVARIYNLDGTSGNTLTDDMISDAISKFPAGRGPTHIICNRTTLKELQQSRSATNPTGSPAPYPENSFGVQIILTDNMATSNTLATTTTT
jgi:hypothetical protein